MPDFRYVVADVFTDTPLTGNQLAVFTDARELDGDAMQSLTREMNFSESIFVLPPENDGHVKIRIFTPDRELPFAGHPVLGAAFVLGQPLQLVEIGIETGSGTIRVQLEREGPKITFGRMSQPIPTWRSYERAEELLAVLGVESELPVDWYSLGPSHVYIALRTPEEVAALRPNSEALLEFDVGVNCFAPLGGSRWKTRMFAPAHGVAEDPATGSAAGPLAVHLLRHGRISSGDEIEIEQGAEINRPSKLYAKAEGTPEKIDRVEVGGCAVVVARGEFRLP
jgi:trans-2,3-dihydro-3-hydroxyanthranilate isomerase